MLFKEFRKTDDYFSADVISFIDINGEDCEDTDDEVLDNMNIIDIHRDGGYLELTLN